MKHFLALLSLALLAVSFAAKVQAAPPADPCVPFRAAVELTYEHQEIDPDTGMLVTTGTARATGTFGATEGPFELHLDLVTYSFSGSRLAVAADGSSYVVDFSGQFLDAVHSVIFFDVRDGTGRYEGLQVSGTGTGTEWPNGAGNSSLSTGTATL